MRLATLADDDVAAIGLVDERGLLPLAIDERHPATLRDLAAAGAEALERIRVWASGQPSSAWRRLADVALGPAVPEPGAIYTIGLNYDAPGGPRATSPARPLVYGKLPSSVAGPGAVLAWDRSLTANVDAEVELGVVIGAPASSVTPEDAMGHVFGYTCVNDVSSRDSWLDGDQWLLGKSMAGFCPVGPWVVTTDEVQPDDLRLGCSINGHAIQDGRTADMRSSIAEIVAFLSRHVDLRPGDLIATGTPARLTSPPGPDRHLQSGDVVVVWIETIGELTTVVA